MKADEHHSGGLPLGLGESAAPLPMDGKEISPNSDPQNQGASLVKAQPPNRRPVYRWSKAARDLVRTNLNASGAELSNLLTRLVEESGYPRWACRKFMRSMGIRAKR